MKKQIPQRRFSPHSTSCTRPARGPGDGCSDGCTSMNVERRYLTAFLGALTRPRSPRLAASGASAILKELNESRQRVIMSLEPYSPCSCGSGKKFKWCCQPIYADINHALELDANGQHDAALKAMEQVTQQHPGNPEARGQL